MKQLWGFIKRGAVDNSAVLLAILILVFCLLGMIRSTSRVFDNWRDSSVPEGSIVWSIHALFGPESVYRDIHHPPYATTAYGPAYYVTTGLIARALGDGIDGAYRSGRTVSLLAFLVVVACVYLLSRQNSGRLPSIASALCLTTVTLLDGWVTTCRPDLLAAALSVLGVFTLHGPGKRKTTIAATLFGCALLVKQSYVAAPVSAFLWLFSQGNPRGAFELTLKTCVVACTGYLCAWLVWGSYLIDNVFGANLAPLSFNLPLVLQYWSFYSGYVVFLSAIVGICGCWHRQEPLPLTAYYLLVALLLAGVTSVKAGADANYYIEPVFAAAMAGAAAWRDLALAARSRRLGSIVPVLIVVIVLQPAALRRWLQYDSRPYVAESDVAQWIGSFKNPLLGSADLAVKFGRRPMLLDTFNASYLSDRGQLEFDELVQMMDQGQIDAVITDIPLDAKYYDVFVWPAPIRQRVAKHYRAAPVRIHGFLVYTLASRDSG